MLIDRADDRIPFGTTEQDSGSAMSSPADYRTRGLRSHRYFILNRTPKSPSFLSAHVKGGL